MGRTSILLLHPTGDQPSPVDQALGSRLAATVGSLSQVLAFEQDAFRHGDLIDLEKRLRRWAGWVAGVVGSTGVAESTRLGELAEELNLLCFVANNNPAVWQGRGHVFHLGVPTAITSRWVARYLAGDLGARRVCLLHDETEFQTLVADTCATFLRETGAEVHSFTGSQNDWTDDVRSWAPDVLYLVYSDESRSAPMIQRLRGITKELPIVLGRSLLRQSFFTSLGELAEGLLLVDLFARGQPRNGSERSFTQALSDAGIVIPTANHGFGWDAMALCGEALATANGDPRSAIRYLESGARVEGATGYFSFNPKDHNGRSVFNPTTLSRISRGRVEAPP